VAGLRLTSDSIYVVGLIILTTTSIPAALENGAGLPGLIITMVIMGMGVGGVKATIGPFIGRARDSMNRTGHLLEADGWLF